MKIWFDLTNSPHVHFFREMINELRAEGHELIITARDQANTIDLLNLYGIEYTIVGKSYGKKLIHKILGNICRVFLLVKLLNKQNVDVAISQSSFTSPIAGFFLKVPTIYTNDNEHALGNKVAFIFASKILVPEFIPLQKVEGPFVSRKKILQYPGVKEGIYLWRDHLYVRKSNLSHHKLKVYYRPEPYSAQYYNGRVNGFDELLVRLKESFNIVILPRDKFQIEHFSQSQFVGMEICCKPLAFDEIVSDCDLFIGAGGTMTREMAVCGIPTISVYQGELLDVDRFLIDNNLMLYNPNLTEGYVLDVMRQKKISSPNLILLEKGKKAYELIKSLLTK